MKNILVIMLSLFVYVTNLLALAVINLFIPFSLALIIRDIDIVLGGLTIILSFITIYIFNKFMWNIYIKDAYYTFISIISTKRNV